MKSVIILLLIVSGNAYGQNEFQVFSNGLIYDESTMNRLGVIVDSLNVRFRTCDLSHPYYSYPQGMATWVEVPNKIARKLIEDGISIDDYSNRFPKSVIKKNLWVIKTTYKNYEGVDYIKYAGLPYGWSSEPAIRVKKKRSNDKNSGWIIDHEKTKAFYMSNLERQEIPYEYARLVQYVDCMIDTTAAIYFPDAKGRVYQEVEPGTKAYQFIEWTERYPGKPEYPDYEKIEKLNLDFDSAYSVYREKYSVWDSLRMIHLDQQMNTSKYWNNLLMEAADESVATGNSDAQLEFYVARYLSKEYALNLMRSRRVIGNCSQDPSPRYHAMSICVLAAETTKWDIFLRSHLDIMNDRFDRMSDGSYAWGRRKTYLKELEELDINAIDLLLGTCLRVENVNDNHYFGSINRVGRALADASNRELVEERMLRMIGDEKFDPYNRLLIAYLMNNYSNSLDEEAQKEDALHKLEVAIASMPPFVSEVWTLE